MNLVDSAAERRNAWPYLLVLGILLWAVMALPSVLEKTPGQFYLIQISPWTLAKLAGVFYGSFLFPGLAAIAWKLGDFSWRTFFSPRRILLAFAFGCGAHVLAIFLQKYANLPYGVFSVLACLALAYGALGFLAGKTLDIPALLAEDSSEPAESPFESGLTLLLSVLSLALAWEMTLRGRASSVNMIGDGYPHFINLLGTLADGPMPDALPFYSTFVTNIHPMAFHALWADLKTLTPGLLHVDLLRYFSVLMVPLFFACMMAFFSVLTSRRLIAAMGAAATMFISGGGLSLKIPILYYPWYWSIAWCLTAALFFLLLKDGVRRKGVGFWAGWVFGAGVLMHPFFAFRVGIILLCFFPVELARRLFNREPLRPFFLQSLCFGLGGALPVLGWIVPLVLRHGWEASYSYEEIVASFKALAPEGVAYIQRFREAHFSVAGVYAESRANAGLFPFVLFPLGIYAAFRRRERPASSLLLAWFFGMAGALWVEALPNRYRYLEYLFFAQAALAVYGLDIICRSMERFRAVAQALALGLLFLSIRVDFAPKYRYALSIYGSTGLTEAEVQRAESRAFHYLQAKQAGELDSKYGSYTGYLWSRQKKVWDIYVKNQQARKATVP